MTTLQEAAMRQAIAALEESKRHLTDAMREAAIDRLCDALAQQGEPVVLSDDVLDFELRGYLTSLTFWCHLPVDDADELAAFFVKFLRERPRNWRQVNAAAPAPQAQEPCPNGSKCKHGAWCTEVYCQELCEFRNQPAPQP